MLCSPKPSRGLSPLTLTIVPASFSPVAAVAYSSAYVVSWLFAFRTAPSDSSNGETGEALSLPSVKDGGAASVWKDTSLPRVNWPSALVATRQNLYSRSGSSPVTSGFSSSALPSTSSDALVNVNAPPHSAPVPYAKYQPTFAVE